MIINRVVKQRLRQTRVVKKLFKTNIKTPSDRRRDHRRAFDADTDADVHPNDVLLLLLLLWPNFVYSFPPLRFFRPRLFTLPASQSARSFNSSLASAASFSFLAALFFLAFVSCLSGCHFKANFLKLFLIKSHCLSFVNSRFGGTPKIFA